MDINDSELARRLGVDPSLVSRDKRRGMPTHSVEAAAAWRAENVRVRVRGDDQGERDPSSPTDLAHDRQSYEESRRRREAAEAELAELKLAEANGQLVDRDTIRNAHARAASAFRDALLQLSARVAPLLAGEVDPAKIRALLDAEHRHALQQFAEGAQ